MYHMILLVMDKIEQAPAVLDGWEAAGVGGITILESTGLGRVRQAAAIRDDFPLMPSIVNLLKGREERHRTLFTVVEGEELVERVIAATEEALGDLNEPDNGFLVVLPVSRVAGLRSSGKRTQE